MVKKIYIKDENIPTIKPNIACIGYFDCVHIGHQDLINKTVALSKKLGLTPTAICFNPDPSEVINKRKSKQVLNIKDRLNLFEYFGIKQVIIIKFNNYFMSLSPNEFINKFLNKFNTKKLICGYDFSFGKNGIGNTNTLSKNRKFETIVIKEHKYLGKKVSTSRIKDELMKGNFRLVNKLLGYEYVVSLKVEKSSKRGLNWLISARNVNKNTVILADGKYGKGFEIKDGIFYLTGKTRLQKGQIILLGFSDYE